MCRRPADQNDVRHGLVAMFLASRHLRGRRLERQSATIHFRQAREAGQVMQCPARRIENGVGRVSFLADDALVKRYRHLARPGPAWRPRRLAADRQQHARVHTHG